MNLHELFQTNEFDTINLQIFIFLIYICIKFVLNLLGNRVKFTNCRATVNHFLISQITKWSVLLTISLSRFKKQNHCSMKLLKTKPPLNYIIIEQQQEERNV